MFEDVTNYGIDVNVSIVFDEDGCCSIGCHINDSEGFDVIAENDGENFYDTFLELCEEIVEIAENYDEEDDDMDEADEVCDEAAKMIIELQEEMESMKIDQAILKKRLDDIVNARTRPITSPGLNCNCKPTRLAEKYAENMEMLSRILGIPLK